MYPNSREAFETFCTEYLNKEQQDIVDRQHGIMIVHAGAGSGKTRVITARVTSLMLKYGVQPSGLLALTFTNKAAREMKERVIHFLGPYAGLPFVGTFHSYCVRLLRTHKDLLETPDFTIMDDDDQEKLIRVIAARHNIHKKITPRTILAAISRIKNTSVTGAIDLERIEDPLMRDLTDMYEKEKTASRCFDFDDLLLKTLKLLKKEPQVKNVHQNRIRHILVDEYQDTNHVQHALLKEMILNDQGEFGLDSLCVVGDEDQSIYSWRGAVAGTMVTFKNDFPTAHSLTLEQNYRSAQPILDTANELIQNNTFRKPKKLWSEKKGSDRVRLLMCVSGYQEAEIVSELCRQHKQKTGTLTDCAILYRSHYQSRSLEEALVRNSIPYKIVGGIQFYDRLEVKDLLAYLKLTANPFDRVSWLRAINTPTRGLGDKFQEQFIELWDRQPFLNFKDVAQLMIKESMVTGLKREGLLSFLRIFDNEGPQLSVSERLEQIIENSGYIAYLKNSFEPNEADDKHDNVKELIHAITSREEQGVTTVSQFLEEVALLQENVKSDEQDCVRLMTLHSAKGLEFNTVMLTGLEEGILPSSHSLYTPESIEEERRLLYVGITRAQERLLMTYTRYRYTYGQMTDQRASRFIKEIMSCENVAHHDGTQWGFPQVISYCRQWLNTQTPQTPMPNTPHENEKTQEAAVRPAQTESPSKTWYVNQKVTHAYFGTGTIESIDAKAPDLFHLTIRFNEGLKKISSQFVKPMS